MFHQNQPWHFQKGSKCAANWLKACKKTHSLGDWVIVQGAGSYKD
jgi:hypothetical protein